MKQRSLFIALSQVMIVSVLLGACAAPAAVPTATIAPAPTAVVFPTAAPTTAPTVAPTTAPATAAPTTAATTAATAAPTTAPTTAPAGPTKGGTLTIVDNVDYATMDPFNLTWTNPAYGLMYDFLVVYKPDYSGFASNLADSWTFAADNLSVTFNLHPGVKFQDGTPMDAAAVKWNIDRYRDKKVASPASDVLGGLVTDVSTPDDHTVVLKLSQPSAILLDTISGMGMVSPTAFQKIGADNYGQSPVGTGPYFIKGPTDQVANDHRTLTRNPDYAWPPTWFDNKGAVYPDTVVVKQLTDDATMFSALQTGQVQVAPIPTQFLDQARKDSNLTVVQGIENGIQYIGFNNQAAPFDNKNVRQAIGYAINRDELVKVGWNNEADPIYGPLSPSQFGYSQNAETVARKQSYNPDTAKKMLAAEGWVPGSDGILAKAGKKLEVRFLFVPDDPSKRVAETIQSQLADIGVKIDLAPEDIAALKDETKKGTHQMFLLYITLADPRSMCFQFCSANIGGTDRTRFKNDDLDKALAAMDSELNPDKRKALVEAAEMIIIDQRPEIPIAVKHLFYGYRKDMVGGMKFDVLAGAQYQDAYLLKP